MATTLEAHAYLKAACCPVPPERDPALHLAAKQRQLLDVDGAVCRRAQDCPAAPPSDDDGPVSDFDRQLGAPEELDCISLRQLVLIVG